MTAAYRLRGAGWLLTCVCVALAFYLVSLRVAEERKHVEQADARIAAAQRDIRALETEFDTRANLVQLERWNGDTLALAAPVAGQFVRDEAALASIDVQATPLPVAAGGSAEVRTAAMVVPAIAAPAAPVQPQPVAVAAVSVPAHPLEKAKATPRLDPGMTRVAAVHLAPVQPAPARVAAATRPVRVLAHRDADEHDHSPTKSRMRVAMLDGKLLSDATMGDLLASARTEAGRRR
jgi:hypothetical protein